MEILVVNPNTTASMTDKIRAAVKRVNESFVAWAHSTQEMQALLPMALLLSSCFVMQGFWINANSIVAGGKVMVNSPYTLASFISLVSYFMILVIAEAFRMARTCPSSAECSSTAP
jgi:hypothetical protein